MPALLVAPSVKPELQRGGPSHGGDDLLSGATFGPELDGIGIEHSGFDVKVGRQDYTVLCCRLEADVDPNEAVQRIVINRMRGDDPSHATQFAVRFPCTDGVQEKLAVAVSDLEHPATFKQGLSLLSNLVKGGHLTREEMAILPDGAAITQDIIEGRRTPGRMSAAVLGSVSAFEERMVDITRNGGIQAKRAWLESNYHKLREFEGSLSPEVAKEWAALYQKYGMKEIAQKLRRVNVIDPDAHSGF